MHQCWVIQPDTSSQVGHLSGLCVIGVGNLSLLDRIINTHCWLFFVVSSVRFLSNKRRVEVWNLHTDFQLLNISGLSCECVNISVLFFVSNVFLSVNLDSVIVTHYWIFFCIFMIFSSNNKRFEVQQLPCLLADFQLLAISSLPCRHDIILVTFWK